MGKKTRDRIPESKLLKALADLEDTAKGDPLDDADPEGGLSPEGEPLSSAAPSGRGDGTRKSSRRSSASSPFGSRSSSSGASSSASDDDDDDAASMMSSRKPPPAPPRKPGKKVSKAEPPASSMSSDDDDDDASGDDSGSGDPPAEKSFRQRAENDETMRKAIVVNRFIESMVDQLSLALHSMTKSVKRSFDALEARLTAHIDSRVAKSMASQHSFNVRMAKAVSAIGNTIQDDLVDIVKSIADQPAGQPRGRAVLSKGEVNQPPWSGFASRLNEDQRLLAGGSEGGGGVDIEALRALPPNKIGDWLFAKSAKNQLDSRVILAWEADRYDPAMLPPTVQKALADDLIQ